MTTPINTHTCTIRTNLVQGTCWKDVLIPVSLKFFPKCDILTDCAWKNPWQLTGQSNTSLNFAMAGKNLKLIEQVHQQRRLTGEKKNIHMNIKAQKDTHKHTELPQMANTEFDIGNVGAEDTLWSCVCLVGFADKIKSILYFCILCSSRCTHQRKLHSEQHAQV